MIITFFYCVRNDKEKAEGKDVKTAEKREDWGEKTSGEKQKTERETKEEIRKRVF